MTLLVAVAAAQTAPRPFTLADDIGLSHFGDPYTDEIGAFTFSPNQQYFVVDTERGLLAKDRSESTLRVFRTSEVLQAISRPLALGHPAPVWVLKRALYKDGPAISQLRWLNDSTAFAFLVRSQLGNRQLFLANLKTKAVLPLTVENSDVTAFEIRDARNYVYSVLSSKIQQRAIAEDRAPSIVGTGRSILDLLFTADKYPSLMSRWHDFSDLWAVVDGRRLRVRERTTGQPVHLYRGGLRALALSPDARSIVTLQALPLVPNEWELTYPPPYASFPYRIKPGPQDLSAFEGYSHVSQFVRIDLLTGEIKALTGAPTGFSAGWWHAPRAKWSPTGHEILLSNTFIPAANQPVGMIQNRPCIAVAERNGESARCLEYLKGAAEHGYETDFKRVDDFGFVGGDQEVVIHSSSLSGAHVTSAYKRLSDGSWLSNPSTSSSVSLPQQLELSIRQSYDDPPVLIATDTRTGIARPILDPNPQLRHLNLGKAARLEWKDKSGRDWSGVLYTPPDLVPGQRYPLVVQTHASSLTGFEPSGTYPTGSAARELAAVGIVVLQVPTCPVRMTTEEAACNVAGYEAAVEQLARDGLVDPQRVGITGFSRTCYHVLEALASSSLHFQAASITDGINFGYLEYLAAVDDVEGGFTGQADAVMGAAPFGTGLAEWVSRSPEFNLNKVTTPLQVVANGRCTVLEMWEPYASLRLQHKPVDLIVLRSGTHVLTSPQERFASQGAALDWLRFWLQGYQDPDPAKSAQYARWGEMRRQSQDNQ